MAKQIDHARKLAESFGASLLEDIQPNGNPISTGCLAFDFLLQGGIPSGLITEIVGDFSTGKSMLGLQLCREVIKAGGWAVLIDSENSINKDFATKVLGVDENLMYFIAEDLESTYEFLVNLLEKQAKKAKAKKPCVIVWDTPAATPPAIVKGTKSGSPIAPAARVHSERIPLLLNYLRGTGIALVLVNQLRSKIGVLFGQKWESYGGRAIRFYSSLRLHLTRGGRTKKNEQTTGTRGRMEIIKSRICRPFTQVEFTIDFDRGIPPWSGTLELFKKAGIIRQGKNSSLLSYYPKEGDRVILKPIQISNPEIYQQMWDQADKEKLEMALSIKDKHNDK